MKKITIKYCFPIPWIEDMMDELVGAKYFSKMISEVATTRSTFERGMNGRHHLRQEMVCTNGWLCLLGFWTYLTHLCGWWIQFCEPYIGKFVVVYFDDIMIYSRSKEEHLQHLRIILSVLTKEKLFANLKKCRFMQTSLTFLGFVISQDGVQMDP